MIASTPPARLTRPRAAVRRLAGPAAPSLVVVGLLTVGLLAFLPAEMSPDGWYALLGGDVIVHHGLPGHDVLTVWGHGRRWVDQQWLAQLAYYGLYAAGGLRLALLVNAAVVAGSFAAAAAAGRTRGGRARDVLPVAVVAAVSIGLTSASLRPQTLALPLFVALVWLLADDARRPSGRVFWAVPLLVLWAQLHGSVTLGALLVLLAAAASAWSRRSLKARDAALAVLAVAAPFASPYATHLPAYYRTILFSGDFAKYLPDWMPTALSPQTLAFYVLAFGAVVLLARAGRELTPFERLTLLVLLLLGVEARRGVTWFTLFALATLPAAMRGASLPAIRLLPERGRAVLAGTTAIALTAVLAVSASRPASWYARDYPAAAATAAAVAAGAQGRVFANGAYADWLLLLEPSLRGRVAYDARFELLPHGRLADAAAVSIGRWDAGRILRPFDVLVLRPQERELRETLTRSGGWRRVATNGKVVVLRRA